MAESGRAREVVERLLRAEGQASERLAEAEEHARQRLEEATAEAERRRARASEQADQEHSDGLDRTRIQAEAEAAAHVEALKARWTELAEAVRPRVDDAAARVVAWVCGVDPIEGSG